MALACELYFFSPLMYIIYPFQITGIGTTIRSSEMPLIDPYYHILYIEADFAFSELKCGRHYFLS